MEAAVRERVAVVYDSRSQTQTVIKFVDSGVVHPKRRRLQCGFLSIDVLTFLLETD